MADPFDVSITVSFSGGVPSSNPNPAVIADVNTNGTVDITWIPSGCTITNIVWTSPGAPANPTPVSGSSDWSVSYPAPATPMSWNYTVTANEPGGPDVPHDPEIDNVNP